MFQSGIKIFRIFADQNDVHVFKPRFHSRKIFDWPDIGVKIERFSQGHVNAGRATGNGGAHRAFQRHAVAAHGLDGAFGDKLSRGRCLLRARFDFFPIELNASGFQNARMWRGRLRVRCLRRGSK